MACLCLRVRICEFVFTTEKVCERVKESEGERRRERERGVERGGESEILLYQPMFQNMASDVQTPHIHLSEPFMVLFAFITTLGKRIKWCRGLHIQLIFGLSGKP